MSDVWKSYNANMLEAVGTLRTCSRKLWAFGSDNQKITDDVRTLCLRESYELSQYAAVTLVAWDFLSWSRNKQYIIDEDVRQLQEAPPPVIARKRSFDDIVIRPLEFHRKIKAGLGQAIAASSADLVSRKTGSSHMSLRAQEALQTSYYLMGPCYEGSVNQMLKRTEECSMFDVAYTIQTDLAKKNLTEPERYTLHNEFTVLQNYYENNRFTEYPEMYIRKRKGLSFNMRIWAASQYIKPKQPNLLQFDHSRNG